MPATIPAKTEGSLGTVLTDTRTPVGNELTATHVERIKSLLIEISAEIGATGAPASGSILERLAGLENSIDWRSVVGSIVSVGGDVAIGASDSALVVDTSVVRTLTLPDPSTVTGVLPFLVIDGSNNAASKPISLARYSAEQIDGVAASKSLAVNGGRWWVWTNGVNWYTAECAPASGGSGDVVGPASATDNALPRFDGTTGKLIQGSGVLVDDGDNLSTAGGLSCATMETSGDALIGGALTVTGAIDAPEATRIAAGLMPAIEADAAFSMRDSYRHYADFENGITATVWVSSVSGAGAAVGTTGTTYPNHVGIVQLSTGTTATGRASIALRIGALLQLGGGQTKFDVVVQVPALSDGTETFDIFAGLAEILTGEPTDGVYFAYDHDGLGATWYACCAEDGVRTRTSTGVTVAAGTWVRLGAVVNAAGTSVDFYVDGTLVATITTDIPVTSDDLGFMATQIKSAGLTARTTLVDLVAIEQRFTTPR